MGTPRRKPRAILSDSWSILVPELGSERALSHPPASEEATDSNQAFALESTAEFKMAK